MIRSIIAAILNGIWSGYPTCCVRYYCRAIRIGRPDVAMWDAENRGANLAAEWTAEGGERGPQYVRCPMCRKSGRCVPKSAQRAGRIISEDRRQPHTHGERT